MKKTLITTILALLIIQPVMALAQGVNYRFTGQELDAESGLYNFQAREYNPNTGRFLQPDPVINNLSNHQELKNQTGQKLEDILKNPQALNSYSYTVNNPVKYVDPTGEIFIIPIAIGVLSGIFLSDIKIAQAPTVNSTPPIVETKDFGDLVSGWNKIPKFGRFGIGLIFGGFTNKLSGNIASRLATKLDTSFANSLAKRADDGFLKLYRGVNSLEYEKMMTEGLSTFKHITTDISEAMGYMGNKGVNPELIKFKIPINNFVNMVEDGTLIKGSFGEEFLPRSFESLQILNSYIIKK